MSTGITGNQVDAGFVLPRQKMVPLTNAQVLALPTTAVEIVPAPGENILIVPQVVLLHMKWVADYTNISADCVLKCDLVGTFVAALHEVDLSGVSALLAGGGPDGTWVAMTLNQLASAKTTTATPNVDPHNHQGSADSGFYDADIVNAALTLSATNTGDFADGSVDNELQVSVAYYLLDTVTGLFI